MPSVVDYNGLLNKVRDAAGVSANTRRVEIAAISADLPGVTSSSTDNVIDLKPVELTARELKELFYSTGNEFKVGEVCSLSDCLKNKLKFDNMVTCDPEDKPLNIAKEVVSNIISDLNIDPECWDDCSRVNIDKALSGITSILDLAERCREVDCSMTFNEYLGVLSRIGVSIVNHDTNKISPENVNFDPANNKIHAVQAREFNCEPVWWGKGTPTAPGNDLDATLTRRNEYENLGFTYQQVTTGVVFKIPNPDANDTVIRVNFNVNWASYEGDSTTAGEEVTFRSGEKVFKPYLPVVNAKVTKGGVSIDTSAVGAPVLFAGNADSGVITVDDTSGFFNGQSVALYKADDGSLITNEVTIKTLAGTEGGILSKTELILTGADPAAAAVAATALTEGTLIKPI